MLTNNLWALTSKEYLEVTEKEEKKHFFEKEQIEKKIAKYLQSEIESNKESKKKFLFVLYRRNDAKWGIVKAENLSIPMLIEFADIKNGADYYVTNTNEVVAVAHGARSDTLFEFRTIWMTVSEFEIYDRGEKCEKFFSLGKPITGSNIDMCHEFSYTKSKEICKEVEEKLRCYPFKKQARVMINSVPTICTGEIYYHIYAMDVTRKEMDSFLMEFKKEEFFEKYPKIQNEKRYNTSYEVTIKSKTDDLEKVIILPKEPIALKHELRDEKWEITLWNDEKFQEKVSIEELNQTLITCDEAGLDEKTLYIVLQVLELHEVVNMLENNEIPKVIDFDEVTKEWPNANFESDYSKGKCLFKADGYKPFGSEISKEMENWIKWDEVWKYAFVKGWNACPYKGKNYLVYATGLPF